MLTKKSRLQIATALRAAAAKLGAVKAPPQLAALVKMFEQKYPKSKFTADGFTRQAIGGGTETTYTVRSSDFLQDFQREDVLYIRKFDDTDGSTLIDIRFPKGIPSARGLTSFPTAKALFNAFAKAGIDVGLKEDVLPASPTITSVEVRPETVDEWVILDITVKGDWEMGGDSHFLTPERMAFAERVFRKAIPEIAKQAAKWSSKTAQVWHNGSSSPSDPTVAKRFPTVRSWEDVGQVDRVGLNGLAFIVSDR